MRSSHLLLLLSLTLPTTAVLAQTPAPAASAKPAASAARAPALTPAQQAQQARQDAEMTRAALKVAQLVDANRAAEVWDGASVVARKAVTRDAFASQVATDRARLGALVSRGQASITRVKYPADAAVPEGLYLNVSFPTRFANNAQPVRELVSFRLDEDRVWRVSGYSLRAAGH
ncbi:DUF4019 domain-containing protein [Stenotrophomonas sp. YIM B06876]|uniref:DUF4019 domain-containing protein n=1 Tax=Stenotrophomonas sp. YIM B06876 TaxID=3060211 RepID=UPI00273A1778|nr:DUF4019 domain-containing protein [Stenotrophomonas sp. YIM B06876]